MLDDKLEIRIELLNAKGETERLLAMAATIPIGRGAFDAAVKEYGARYGVMMRAGARVIEQRDKTL